MNKLIFFAVLGLAAAFPDPGPLSEPSPTILTAGTIKPCVWPNRCGSVTQVAQFRPCVWPNPCGSDKA